METDYPTDKLSLMIKRHVVKDENEKLFFTELILNLEKEELRNEREKEELRNEKEANRKHEIAVLEIQLQIQQSKAVNKGLLHDFVE